MSNKDPTNNQPHDSNEPPQPPPPSYSETGTHSKYQPPTGPPPGQTSTSDVYQAQPVGDESPFVGQAYTPPAGQPHDHSAARTYAPPPGQPYGQQSGQPHYPPPPAGTNTVIYVVDDPMASNVEGSRGHRTPMAMICFILGLCTWVGYLVGMCYINHPDPRERWWARACTIMAFIWALIIIFASIFGHR